RNVCSAIFIRSKTAMHVYLIVFTPDYEGIRKGGAMLLCLPVTILAFCGKDIEGILKAKD
ncbi:hypothetical protein EDB47_1181, partial [Vibrio crassostreae]|uniref:hypothetical protein n=1 Tax=Vibrio crassostreae TaxID=246167 RepID=UPI0010E3B17B